MAILSKAEIETMAWRMVDSTLPPLKRDERLSFVTTTNAYRSALEAWAKWCGSPDGIGGELFERAVGLMHDAGFPVQESEEMTDG